MSYSILAIRTAADDDGAIFPVIGAGDDLVEPEHWDGTPRSLAASGVSAREVRNGSLTTIGRFSDVKIAVYVTDARVVLACKKWTKGGGWWGFGGAGVAVALVADAVSAARAARRRHGKLLMGQVRYAWLASVGYHRRSGFGSTEQIRLGVNEKLSDGTIRKLYLDLTLPKDVDSAAVAQEIVRRAARYRLAHTPLSKEERAAFAPLESGCQLTPDPNPKNFTLFTFPSAHPVSKSTAYPQGQPASTANRGAAG